MKKWYAEEYEFEIEVTGFLRGKHTERYCRNGEEIGDNYTYHNCAEAGFDRNTLTFRLTRYGFPPIQTALIGRKWLQAAMEP